MLRATLLIAGLSVASVGCGADATPTSTTSAPEPTAPVVISGTTAELLASMAATMSGLGSAVADGGDDDAMLAQITATWDVARAGVQADRPELVASIDTTVEMATRAVERTRPADADKAFKLLTDLVDAYTGDG